MFGPSIRLPWNGSKKPSPLRKNSEFSASMFLAPRLISSFLTWKERAHLSAAKRRRSSFQSKEKQEGRFPGRHTPHKKACGENRQISITLRHGSTFPLSSPSAETNLQSSERKTVREQKYSRSSAKLKIRGSSSCHSAHRCKILFSRWVKGQEKKKEFWR